MRIDLPFCDFRYCQFEADGNCIAKDGRRENCRYLEKQLNNGWIPVSERLPIHEEYLKDDGRFIATDGNRRYQAWFNIYDGCFEIPNRDDIMREDKCVIAWQPLPSVWKGENNG